MQLEDSIEDIGLPTLPSQVVETEDCTSNKAIERPQRTPSKVKHLPVYTSKNDEAEPSRESSKLFVQMQANQDAVKDDIRQTLKRKASKTTFDLYKTDGVWQLIAKHPVFENITLGVISLNAFWMSVDTDWNKAHTLPEAEPLFQFMEHAFCTYFVAELFVRFMALRNKCDGRKDGWFIFDSCLVFMMVSEDWVLLIVAAALNVEAKFPLENTAVLRLLRLLRLSRLMRMLRSMPELMILVKGMVSAMTSVMYVMGLLVICTYVFAIACTQLSAGTAMGETYFLNVALSMYSLVVYATFLDNLADFCNAIREESVAVLFLVLLFIVLACLTLMNMLLGVLCEVIGEVAKTEGEDKRKSSVGARMQDIAESLDSNSNGRVSMAEFGGIVRDRSAVKELDDAGIDPEGIVDLAEVLFRDQEGAEIDLPMDVFVDLVFELRHENSATIRDMQWIFSMINPRINRMHEHVKLAEVRFDRIEEKLREVMEHLRQLISQIP